MSELGAEMRAIVISEPWVSLILSGEKTWEMRSRAWSHKGLVALIRKGSGHVVGLAEMMGCLPEIVSLEAYAAAEPQHRIPPSEQEWAFDKRWRRPWVLANASRLPSSVPYRHRNGAMSLICLDEQPDVVRAVLGQLRG